MERIDTVVVGGGQAGIATSEHLRTHGIGHVVLERGRVAERWRSGRWDSLVANGPAWHDRFPGMAFDADPDTFIPKEAVADYFAAYARRIEAPLRTGVEVTDAAPLDGREGFVVQTSTGPLEARSLVVATGPFQRPVIPPLVPRAIGPLQIHSADYRRPDSLPEGAVVVVGSGSSGAQIAAELLSSGREVYLCVGAHHRPPRSYRGRDNVWWLGVLGHWNADAPGPGTEHVTIAVSGADGGRTVDFRRLAAEGMTLLGAAVGWKDGSLQLAPNLKANLDAGDRSLLALLDEADAFAERHGLDLPLEPEARTILPDPACVTYPILSLDLHAAGVGSIVWATGYAPDYGWLRAGTFDTSGRPIHQRGVGTDPGLFFVGLPWQSRRGSSFIWGVWHDAKFVVDQIAIARNYTDYHERALLRAAEGRA